MDEFIQEFSENVEIQPKRSEKIIEKFWSKEKCFDYFIWKIQDKQALWEAQMNIAKQKTELATSTLNSADSDLKFLQSLMIDLDTEKYESGAWKLSFSNSKKADGDIEKINSKYIVEKTTVKKTLDKKLIKDDIKAGIKIVGWWVTETKTLKIK